jgi:hypothetical protein
MSTITQSTIENALKKASQTLVESRAAMANGHLLGKIFEGQTLRRELIANILVSGVVAHLLEVARNPSRYKAEMAQAPGATQVPDDAAAFATYASNFAASIVADFTR